MWAAEAKAKKTIPLGRHNKIKRNTKITITKGREFEYAIWCGYGIYDLPKEYVKDIKVISAE